MHNILRIELKKAFHNKMFYIGLGIATILSILSAVYNIEIYYTEMIAYNEMMSKESILINPNLPLYSLFNSWICEDFGSLATQAFFFLLPIFSVLGYGWSFFYEKKNGYIKNVITRTSKKNYFTSKYIATFLSGGVLCVVPVIFNFLLVSLFIPAVTPHVFYDIGWTVSAASMFSGLFFEKPFLYVCCRILLVFLYGGAFGLFSFGLSFFLNNRFAVLLCPFLITLALHYGESLFPQAWGMPELSPIYILGANGYQIKMLLPALIEPLLIIGITLLLSYQKGGKADVF